MTLPTISNYYSKSKSIILLFIACVFSTLSFTQSTANYTFASATTASLTDMSAGTSSLVNSSQDDTPSSVTSIGFDFYFMGTRYSQFSVNANGLFRFGSTVVGSTYTNTLSTGTDLPLLAPFWDDLATSGTGKVHYKTTGSAPNRILIVEWKNMSINRLTAAANGTFQVRLYETTGVIEYVYGSMAVGSSSGTVTSSIGFTYANSNNSLISVQTLSSPTVLRTTAGVVDNLVNTSSSGNIANLNSAADGSRVMYTYTPPTTSAPTSLSFTSVTAAGMTLNWTNNGSNRVVSAIYNSTDNVTFTYVGTAASGATSYVATGLTGSTTYYWQVYSVSEGYMSSALTGNHATSVAPTAYIWDGGGGDNVWTTGTNWDNDVPPVTASDVTFNTNSTFTVTSVPTLSINSLTISNGTVTLSGASTLTVGGNAGTDFTISSSKGFTVNGVSITLANSATADISGTFTITSGTFNTNGTSVVSTVSTSGSIVNSGTVTCSSTSKLIFEGSSSYTHACDGGTIPTADWNGATNTGTSTCTVTGMVSTKPGGVATTSNTFYHFTWNCASQSTYIDFASAGSFLASGENFSCLGNFTFTSSNGYDFVFSDVSGGSASVISIGGNFVSTASSTAMIINDWSTPVTLNISGNLNISNTTIYGRNYSTGATTAINVTGSVNITSGNLVVASSSYSGMTLTVSGDLVVSGGAFYASYGTGSPTTNVTGNLNLSSGFFIGAHSSGAPAVNITGNIAQTGGTFLGSDGSGSPVYIIGGSVNISAGTFYGTDWSGSPTFTITGNIALSGTGTFEGSVYSGSPIFNVTGNFSTSSGDILFARDVGTPTLNLSGNLNISGTGR